jgi:tetratricopeptide (TPR) repeat protein
MMQTNKYDEAEKWYQRAISIDPYQETAYRYSATPLMKQGKFDLARGRYVEAYITAPYDRLALSGLVQWGQTTKTPLGHPRIDIPKTTVGADGKPTTTIDMTNADDGSMAWIAYSGTRSQWVNENFKKAYPGEKQYRHSLAEEVDALRSVVSMAKSTKPKKLNEQIAMIESLDKDGVLEAYVLLAVPDAGIARDHRDYLRRNREKLRLYVNKYVIGSGK